MDDHAKCPHIVEIHFDCKTKTLGIVSNLGKDEMVHLLSEALKAVRDKEPDFSEPVLPKKPD